jgi:hypothetical protein
VAAFASPAVVAAEKVANQSFAGTWSHLLETEQINHHGQTNP